MTTTTPELRRTLHGLRGSAPMSRAHPVFAIGLVLMGVAACAFPLGTSLAQGPSLFALVALPFSLVGLAMIGVAAWLLVGSRAVVVKRKRLALWYGVGPLGFRVRLPGERLERLRVEVSKASETSGGVRDLPYNLVAVCTPGASGGMDRVTLAESDDPRWLCAWGEELAQELDTAFAVARAVTDALAPADDGVQRPVPSARYQSPPAGSPFTLEAREGHVTITGALDRAGRERTRSYLVMGAVFMATPVVAGFFVYEPGMSAALMLGLGSMLLLFFYVGAVLFGYGLFSRGNRWILDVTQNTLLINARQAGRSVTRTMDAGSVRSVRVAHSGESSGGNRKRGVEGTPVMQLQIVPRSGPWFRLMTGCEDASLAWAEGVLDAALGLGDIGGEAPKGDDAPA